MPSDAVLRNVEASRTATQVPCPYCGQGIGEACVTKGPRPNEANFTHMVRVHKRHEQMDAER